MSKPKAELPLIFGLIALALFHIPNACQGKLQNKDCGYIRCGDLNISFPFRLKSQPWECGVHILELDCDDNNRTTLSRRHGKFFVEEINYENYTVRVVDSSLITDNCSLPLISLFHDFCVCAGPYCLAVSDCYNSSMYLVNCTKAVKSALYLGASRCTTTTTTTAAKTSFHPPNSYLYFIDEATNPRHFDPSCTVIAAVPTNGLNNISAGMSTSEIYQILLMGFELSWRTYYGLTYGFSHYSSLYYM
ncbi:hypothetical protein PTKIN_Ptkin19aG0089200 [Pterospermum kingtungense]